MSTKLRPQEGVGRHGAILFKGEKYEIQFVTREELSLLNTKVLEDMHLQKALVERPDLPEMFETEREMQRFCSETYRLIALRKQQLAAIEVEFIRRKSLTAPLHNFLLDVMRERVGSEQTDEILNEAKIRRDQHEDSHRLNWYFKRGQRERRRFMCGNKQRHATPEEADQQLQSMRASRLNTRGMAVYGPCPYCGWYHVGHQVRDGIMDKLGKP